MIQKTARAILNYVLLKRSFSSNRKILVIESDDWGTVRMPSSKAFDTLLKKGYPVDRCVYSSNDSLETADDIQELLNVLASHKNNIGEMPVMTLNNIVANPDFEAIRKDDFQKYYLEPFTQTLLRLQGSDQTMRAYRTGIAEKLIKPQFHGREHVNINRWIPALRDPANTAIREAFDLNMFTVHTGINASCRTEYLDAFGYGYELESESHAEIVSQGLDLFEKIWGFRSESFIAPCYVWHSELEKPLSAKGVRVIQGSSVQRHAVKGQHKWFTRRWRFTGQTNRFGQTFLVRNVLLEPSENKNIDWADLAFAQTKLAFENRKPAIVSAHRVNFIGSLRPANREWGLKNLDKYLKRVVMTWPDVEFMTSDQLGLTILNKIKY